MVWDGPHYYANHSAREHRCGNIVVAVFDVDWNLEASTTIMNNPPFPPPLGPNVTRNGRSSPRSVNSLFVSYDVGDYVYNGGSAVIEKRDWQAHMSVVRVATLVDVPIARAFAS